MLEQLLEQRVALTAANAELSVPAELCNCQWSLAEKLVKLLQIFEEATREASGNYSSAAVVIPIVNSIYCALEITEEDLGVISMKRTMLTSLKHRYQDMESNKYYVLATVLDPRFKLLVFSSASASALAKQMLIAQCEILVQDTEPNEPVSEPQAKRACTEFASSSSLL